VSHLVCLVWLPYLFCHVCLVDLTYDLFMYTSITSALGYKLHSVPSAKPKLVKTYTAWEQRPTTLHSRKKKRTTSTVAKDKWGRSKTPYQSNRLMQWEYMNLSLAIGDVFPAALSRQIQINKTNHD
jgi:hypothetical protein